MDTKNSAFRDLKLYIEELIPLDRDYLHILVGAMLFAIYFVWTIVQRKRIRAHEAIGTVLFIAVVGELLDIHDDILEHEHPDIAEKLGKFAEEAYREPRSQKDDGKYTGKGASPKKSGKKKEK